MTVLTIHGDRMTPIVDKLYDKKIDNYFGDILQHNPFHDDTDEPFLLIVQLPLHEDESDSQRVTGYTDFACLFPNDDFKTGSYRQAVGTAFIEGEFQAEYADKDAGTIEFQVKLTNASNKFILRQLSNEAGRIFREDFSMTLTCLKTILSENKIYFEKMDRASRRRIQREHNTDKQDKYLVLSLNQKTYASGESLPSGHKKRYHFVRGHTRTYQNGHIVWIKPHWRGDDELGVIMKDYAA